MNTDQKKIILRSFLWLLTYLFFLWVFEDLGYNAFYEASFFTALCAVFYYLHKGLLKFFLSARRNLAYVIGLLLLLFIGPYLFVSLSNTVLSEIIALVAYEVLFLFALFIVTLSWIKYLIQKWYIDTLNNKELEKQKVSAELAYLKSQINPHFLFNTLNNIHTLAFRQSPETPEAIMRLSQMMRYMIYESNTGFVTVRREVDYLHDFIKLQQLRVRNPAIVNFQVFGEIDQHKIAPLLLIPLLENSYKHSPGVLKEGDIKINLTLVQEQLSFHITNPKNKKEIKTVNGHIGLANLKKRLELIYPENHELSIQQNDEYFSVVLKINLR